MYYTPLDHEWILENLVPNCLAENSIREDHRFNSRRTRSTREIILVDKSFINSTCLTFRHFSSSLQCELKDRSTFSCMDGVVVTSPRGTILINGDHLQRESHLFVQEKRKAFGLLHFIKSYSE